MKFTYLATSTALVAAATTATTIQKRTSNSYGGTSNYFIQGLTSDQQDTYIGQLKNIGVKVVRVWGTYWGSDSKL